MSRAVTDINKKIKLLLLTVIIPLITTACTVDPTKAKPIDPNTAGFWDKYLVLPLSHTIDFFQNILGSYGLAIIAVTILVRLAMFPLTMKSQKGTMAMQKIQPELAKMKEKYKKDPEKLRLETMKLFQENNVNPLAGCLPLLIQAPILFAFYQALATNPEIKNASFLYLQLGHLDPYYIMPILAGITTYYQVIASGGSDNPQMKAMKWFMPLMIFFVGYSMPSALSLYWVISNACSIIQSKILANGKNKAINAATKK